jgi:hypothetical protein
MWESPFAFGRRIETAVDGNFLKEGLVCGLQGLPEFFGAVDDGTCAECSECGLADGKPPGFEVVASTVGTKHAASAKLREGNLGERSDGVTATNSVWGGAGGEIRGGCAATSLWPNGPHRRC